MKRVFIFLFVSLILTSVVNAQDYDKFKLGLGLGYAGAVGSNGGILATFEPAYRVIDNLAVGIRIEGAAFIRHGDEGNSALSYTVNGQYYLNTEQFRTFVGAGLGIYNLSKRYETIDLVASGNVVGGSKLGFYLRIGFDFSHFTLALEYNLIHSSTIEFSNSTVSNNYIGVRIGGFFFGGKK